MNLAATHDDDTASRRLPPAQAAAAVMMVRPAAFGCNSQTLASNRFQAPGAIAPGLARQSALVECDALAAALRGAGVEVHAFDDRAQPACPDAVFPNNWVSFHADGTVVLYPMLAHNRRLERRLDLLLQLEAAGGFEVSRLLDLTHHELAQQYLEGTGSLVLDHVARVAYACLSPRTHRAALDSFCDELGYEACVFSASDAEGVPIYHTNVVLSVGSRHAVVATQTIATADREPLLERLAAGGRHVEQLSRGQTAGFAANVLELRAGGQRTVLVMSSRAKQSLGHQALQRLGRCVDDIVAVPVPTIEALGGGSVRCMLAEVFLPRATGPARAG